MPHHYQVRCRRKSPHADQSGQIEGLGGTDADDGARSWYKSETEIIADIRSQTGYYFVARGVRKVPLVIADAEGGPRLKGILDEAEPAMLLALPECADLSGDPVRDAV